MLAMQRLEAAFGAAFAFDLPLTRRGEPLMFSGPRSSSSNRPPTSRRVA